MSEIMLIVVGAALGVGIGYLWARVRAQRLEAEKSSVQERLDESKAQRAEMEKSLTELREQSSSFKTRNAELKVELTEKQKSFDQQINQFDESKKQLAREFENLANRIFEEKGKTFSKENQASLENMLKPFREQIEGFQKRVNEVHTKTAEGNAEIKNQIENIRKTSIQLSDQADELTNAIKGDKKTTGNWGEVQLERALQLSGLSASDHYKMQESRQDAEGNRRHPDCVLKLPDDKHIVIDSKVSLVDYSDAVAADTEESRILALNAHTKAVRNHIDDLSAKDYSSLVGVDSPNFVLMFMPIEAAYIEAMKHTRDLFDYGYNKNVIMVSNTTLMPIARTIANLWKLAKSDAEASELGNKAGDVYNQVCAVAERLIKLGKTLNTATGHYNDTVVGLAGQQGLHSKVERFKALSVKSTKSFPDIEPVQLLPETKRLEDIVERADTDAAN